MPKGIKGFQKGNKFGKLNKGKKLSKETKLKKSISMKNFFKNNKNTKCGFQKNHKPFPGCEKSYFQKNNIPWNKGLKGVTSGWCKGLSKEELKKHYKNGLPSPPHYKGNRHWNWQGGKSFEIYPIEFKTIKKHIKKKYKKCVKCNAFNNLIVHHIDYNKYNNQENNLVVLCRSCHGKIHQGGMIL